MSKGRIVSKDCGDDFSEAMRIYTLAVKADKANATLRCANMSFAPPLKYADREIVEVRKGRKKVKAKRIIRPLQYNVTMGGLNRNGVWWCPFCVKLRRFVRADAYEVAGVTVQDPVLMCPMCGVSHNHGSVVKYNPYANRVDLRKTRSDKGYTRG